MASEQELRDVRIQKLELLRSHNINPYPSKTYRTHTLHEMASDFEQLHNSKENTRAQFIIAGRIMSMRGQGAILFIDLFDGTARFQVVVKRDVDVQYRNNENVDVVLGAVDIVDGTESGAEEMTPFKLFKKTVDVGDFVEFSGSLFITKTEAHSLEAHSWRMLTKALLPIPTEHFGLKDQNERLRKRYLDILMNQEARDMVIKKAAFWRSTRNFLEEHGFIEVETPTLEVTTGGAEATPFKTHHNDFDLDVFLRISVGELWQKRLMASGLPKVFEIGRVYRNEGSSNEHVQEFTNCEFYAAYMNLEDGKVMTRDLYRTIAEEVFGTTKFTTRDHSFDLADEWTDIDYVGHIEEQTGINVLTATEDEMKDKLAELHVKYDGDNKERLTDTLWKYCRKNISGPAYLINHPKLVAPLSKDLEEGEGSEDGKNTRKGEGEAGSETGGRTEMFQIIIAGSEIGRAHAELNDPLEQLARLNNQADLIAAGDDEAMMKDDEFIEMMEYGMPPCFGFGFGERFFAFLADLSVRESQIFPLMKPEGE